MALVLLAERSILKAVRAVRRGKFYCDTMSSNDLLVCTSIDGKSVIVAVHQSKQNKPMWPLIQRIAIKHAKNGQITPIATEACWKLTFVVS